MMQGRIIMPSKPVSDRPVRTFDGVSHIFLDVGGTTVQANPAAPEIFRRVLTRRGHRVSLDRIATALRSPETILTMIRPLPKDRESEFFRAMNVRIVEHLGFDCDEGTLDELHASFENDVTWTPFPETVRTLRTLRSRGYRLGIISNYSHRLPTVLRDTGLLPYLDTLTYSFDVGAEKPDPRIFRSALARADVPAERALHVGDSYEADYLGARRAGLHAVLLCRRGTAPASCPSIRSLRELPGLLEAPRSRRE